MDNIVNITQIPSSTNIKMKMLIISAKTVCLPILLHLISTLLFVWYIVYKNNSTSAAFKRVQRAAAHQIHLQCVLPIKKRSRKRNTANPVANWRGDVERLHRPSLHSVPVSPRQRSQPDT